MEKVSLGLMIVEYHLMKERRLKHKITERKTEMKLVVGTLVVGLVVIVTQTPPKEHQEKTELYLKQVDLNQKIMIQQKQVQWEDFQQIY
jgi:hypothetical protein